MPPALFYGFIAVNVSVVSFASKVKLIANLSFNGSLKVKLNEVILTELSSVVIKISSFR